MNGQRKSFAVFAGFAAYLGGFLATEDSENKEGNSFAIDSR